LKEKRAREGHLRLGKKIGGLGKISEEALENKQFRSQRKGKQCHSAGIKGGGNSKRLSR